MERHIHFQGLKFGGKQLSSEIVGGYLEIPRLLLQNCGLSVSRSYLESGNTTLTFTFSSQGLGIVDSPLSPLSKVGQGKFRVPPSSLEIGEKNV